MNETPPIMPNQSPQQPSLTTTPSSSIPPIQPIKPTKQKSALPIAIFACLLAVIAIAGSALSYTTATAKVSKNQLATEVKELQDKIKKLEEVNNYEELQVDKDRFQAVFLVGGQVYFGKITEVTKDVIKLENIYYLRGGEFDKSGKISGSDVSLAKLGKEMHGPDDVMHIERHNLEFWENLKDDSEVVKAIKEYEKNINT